MPGQSFRRWIRVSAGWRQMRQPGWSIQPKWCRYFPASLRLNRPTWLSPLPPSRWNSNSSPEWLPWHDSVPQPPQSLLICPGARDAIKHSSNSTVWHMAGYALSCHTTLQSSSYVVLLVIYAKQAKTTNYYVKSMKTTPKTPCHYSPWTSTIKNEKEILTAN